MFNRASWIWFFFFLISMGLVLSFSFVGKFNKSNPKKASYEALRLLRNEPHCQPLTAPCAALASDVAIVARLYQREPEYMIEVRVVGKDRVQAARYEAVFLDKTGRELTPLVSLMVGNRGGYVGLMNPAEGMDGMRIYCRHSAGTLVADMPLSEG